jgi:hypothetical protein
VSGFNALQRARVLLFFAAARPVQGTTQVLSNGFLDETGNPTQSSVKVTNSWNRASVAPYVFMTWSLTKARNSFVCSEWQEDKILVCGTRQT